MASAEFDDEAAQTSLVTAAVLETGQRAVLGQSAHQGGGELAVHGDGEVVGVQGQAGGGADRAEVGGDLARVGAGVEGGGGHEGVGAGLAGGLGVDEHPGGGHVDDSGEDGDAARDRLDDRVEGDGPLPVGEEGDLAAGAQGEQPVHSPADEVLDEPGERGGVDFARRVQRSADGRHDAAQGRGRGHGVSPGLCEWWYGRGRAAGRRGAGAGRPAAGYGRVTVNVLSP